jgi:hypothetical protein
MKFLAIDRNFTRYESPDGNLTSIKDAGDLQLSTRSRCPQMSASRVFSTRAKNGYFCCNRHSSGIVQQSSDVSDENHDSNEAGQGESLANGRGAL